MVRTQLDVLFVRAVLSTVVGLSLMFFVMYFWYVTQPISVFIVQKGREIVQDFGYLNVYVEQAFTVLNWLVYWWGPLLVIAVGIIWMYVSAHREEWRGAYE